MVNEDHEFSLSLVNVLNHESRKVYNFTLKWSYFTIFYHMGALFMCPTKFCYLNTPGTAGGPGGREMIWHKASPWTRLEVMLCAWAKSFNTSLHYYSHKNNDCQCFCFFYFSIFNKFKTLIFISLAPIRMK